MREPNAPVAPDRPVRSGRAFTLIELMVAVSLAVVLIGITAWVFDTTSDAIAASQGNAEAEASLAGLSVALRREVRSIEVDSHLVMGARTREGWGTVADRADGPAEPFRHDWIDFFINAETPYLGNPQKVAQWTWVYYGHGMVADPDGSSGREPSDLAVDWVLMRHQMSLSHMHLASGETTVGGSDERVMGAGVGLHPLYNGQLFMYSDRDAAYAMFARAENWNRVASSVQDGHPFRMAWGVRRYHDTPVCLHEPDWYLPAHRFGSYHGHRYPLFALPHCGSFRVRYAMREHLRSAPDGTVDWQDPPEGDRLVFGPGDEWPILLRFDLHVFDPFNRIVGGKHAQLVCALPRS